MSFDMTRRRRRIQPPNQETLDSLFTTSEAVTKPATPEAQSMAEWAATAPKGRSRGLSTDSMVRAAREMNEMIAAQDWKGATGRHFVALYTFLHLKVYGIECADLGPSERMYAAGQAARMLEREFGGDGDAMAEFMRWCWQRERGTEKWRRENHRSGRRISWRLQFGGQLLVDYRLDTARKGGKIGR